MEWITISGGCGTPSHCQLWTEGVGQTIACQDCGRFASTFSMGYYVCYQCNMKSCASCASLKLLGHQGSSNMVPSSRASLSTLTPDYDEKPVLPCAGLFNHPLKYLEKSPYSNNYFGCNMCGEPGYNDLYHCESCQFDAHKQCAEVEEEVTGFYHEHSLQRYYTGEDEKGIVCQYCQGQVEEYVSPWVYKCPECTDFAVHARCAKYAMSLTHDSHHHQLKLVRKSSKRKSQQCSCDGCGNEILQTIRYTCNKEGCYFNLHPLCAILPSNPLCRMDRSHRVELDYFPLASTKCNLCDSSSDKGWLYRCSECNVFTHVVCFRSETDKDSSDDDDDEEDEHLGELCEKLIESMYNFGNQGNEEKMDNLLELVDSFKSTKEAAATSLLAIQSSVTSTVRTKASTLARSETNSLYDSFTDLSMGNCSPPPCFPDDSPQSTYIQGNRPQTTYPPGCSPLLRFRDSDAAEEDHRSNKEDAKERRRKEKAAARELREQEKAARREEKAKFQAKVCDLLQNFAIELQKIQSSKHSGGNDAAVNQQVAELKAIMENSQKLEARRHQEQVKLNEERHLQHTKLHHEQFKLQHEHANLQRQQNQEHQNVLQEIIRTQVQTISRKVPRLVLCTETSSKTKKLLTSLPLGIKGVQLHLLCEHAQQPHVVAGAPGCEINQKVAGDRWTNLQPFLAAGLKVVSVALNLATTTAGVGFLKDVFPDLHKMVWKTRTIDLGKHALQTDRNEVHPKQEAVAEEAAAQWLVTYLNDQKVNIEEAFKLYRVRFTAPEPIKGTVGWLCYNHLESGRRDGYLEEFPS